MLAPRVLEDRASNVPGSREMNLLAPAALYTQLAIGASSKRLPPPFRPGSFVRYIRWAWLAAGAAQYFSGQTAFARPAIARRLREGKEPDFPPGIRDAQLLGGTVVDLIARGAGRAAPRSASRSSSTRAVRAGAGQRVRRPPPRAHRAHAGAPISRRSPPRSPGASRNDLVERGPVVFAHEIWFVHASVPHRLGVRRPEAHARVSSAAAAARHARSSRLHRARFWPGIDVPFSRRAGAVDAVRACASHLAVSLVGLLSMGVYLSPAMDLDRPSAGSSLGVDDGGRRHPDGHRLPRPPGRWLLVAAGPLGMLEFGVGRRSCSASTSSASRVFVLIAGRRALVGRRRDRPPAEPSLAELGKGDLGAAGRRRRRADRRRLRGEARQPARWRSTSSPSTPTSTSPQPLGLRHGRTSSSSASPAAIEVLFGLLLISGALPQVIV